MMVSILFLIVFVVGPILFFALDRVAGKHWPLVLVVVALILASFALQSAVTLPIATEMTRSVLGVMCVWIAWVLIMVLAARAMRHVLPLLRARRISRMAGAMGTTVPWFGFAAAQMIAS